MNAQLVRNNAVLPFPLAEFEDFTGMEGYPVSVSNGPDMVAHIEDPDVAPIGVVVQGRGPSEKSTIAIAGGGLAGTVRVKLVEDVFQAGTLLRTKAGGINGAFAFGRDPGTGVRTVCAMALEAGAADELIEAVLFQPKVYTS